MVSFTINVVIPSVLTKVVVLLSVITLCVGVVSLAMSFYSVEKEMQQQETIDSLKLESESMNTSWISKALALFTGVALSVGVVSLLITMTQSEKVRIDVSGLQETIDSLKLENELLHSQLQLLSIKLATESHPSASWKCFSYKLMKQQRSASNGGVRREESLSPLDASS
jgi:hypothetical protein